MFGISISLYQSHIFNRNITKKQLTYKYVKVLQNNLQPNILLIYFSKVNVSVKVYAILEPIVSC